MSELNLSELDLLERVKEKPELRPFFFRKASGLKWFDYLQAAGFFDPSAHPPPVAAKEERYVSVPIWMAMEYLVTVSTEFQEPKNEGYAKKTLEIIRSVTKDAIERGFSNYRTWWQFSKVIQNIPADLIVKNDLKLIEYWLNDPYERNLVAQALGEQWAVTLLVGDDAHSHGLSLGVLKLLFRISFVDKTFGKSDRKEAMLPIDGWHASEIIKKLAPRAGEILKQSAVDVFKEALEKIVNTLGNDKWSSLWRPAIESHDQNHGLDDCENVIIDGFRESLLSYAKSSPESGQYVEGLLRSEMEISKRIAIHAIDQCYLQLSPLVGRVVSEEYFKSNFRHEMWQLLNKHFSQFKIDEQAAVLRIIDGWVEYDESGKRSEGATAYKRAVWLSAIKDSRVDLLEKYKANVEVVGGEPEHPDFSSYMTVGFVDHKSPIPKEELLSLEVDELVSRLASYVDPGKYREPGIEGLVKAFRAAIKAEPMKFSKQLQGFLLLEMPYVHAVIEAYSELWQEKAQLPWTELWDNLLRFCRELVCQERFWSLANLKKRDSFVANGHWVVSSVSQLIENGVRSDEHAFPERYLDDALEILMVLLDKEAGEIFKPDSDAVSISINSPRGRCLEAYINLSLRFCRLADKEHQNHDGVWRKLQTVYDAELLRPSKGEYEFATLVVNYLANFLYMSKDWVLGNLDVIFDSKNYQTWLCAMSGYAYVRIIYPEIYGYLKNKGHFIRALDDPNLKKKIDERIIQNVAVAYINDYEEIDDEKGLIHIILLRAKADELGHLIWFIWTLRGDVDEKLKTKIFALWLRLLKVIDVGSKEGRKLASRLCRWAVFVDVVDEQNRLLISEVISYADDGYNSHDLLEMIARLSETQPKDAYEIWCQLLTKSAPDYPEEPARKALSNIYKHGPDGQRNAMEIVSEYLRRGNENPSLWLKEIR